jgi:hypothetical protein
VGLSCVEWDADVTFRRDEPNIPECKEKDLLFIFIYFGKVISFYCLFNPPDLLSETVTD